LLGVLPLVQGLALVEPFIALQSDEPTVGDLRQCLRELRLAYARGSFDEDRSAHACGKEHDGRDAPVGDVAGILEMLLDVLDRLEHGGSCLGKVALSLAQAPMGLGASPRAVPLWAGVARRGADTRGRP